VALLKELTEGLIEDDKVVLQQLISTISNWKNDLMTPAQAAAGAKANGIGSSPTAMGCTMRI
jgi:ATP-dependent DNA helicase Rep